MFEANNPDQDAVSNDFLRHTRAGVHPNPFERFSPWRWITAFAGMTVFIVCQMLGYLAQTRTPRVIPATAGIQPGLGM